MRPSPAATHRPVCELCDGADFEPLAEFDRQGKPLATVICQGCGIISHAAIPTERELTAFYATGYRQQYHREETPRPTRVVRDWRRGQRLFNQLKDALPSNARVFEIGAGVGCNLKHFDLAGYDATGIEPGNGFQKFARETLRARIDSARLEEMSSEPSYDLILLVHVIEHLRSPAAALTQIRKMLRPGGKLYVECPNVAAPHAPPAKLFHFAHIYNFAPQTLTQLAARCGLQVQRAISSTDDRYLQYVFRRSEPRDVERPAEQCQKIRSAVRRYNAITFHLRAKYLLGRWHTLTDYLSAKFCQEGDYAAILSRCELRDISEQRRAA